MAVICICGVCIPYSAIWPLVLWALKYLYDRFFTGKATEAPPGMVCKDGVCQMPGANDKQSGSTESNASCCGEALPSGDDQTKAARSIPSKCSSPPYLTSEMDFAELTKATFPVFVRFTASWCKPCKAIEPLCSRLYSQYSEVCEMVCVDVDEHEDLTMAHKAVPIPTLLCFKRGQVVGRITGSDQEKIRDFVESMVQ